MSDNKGTGKGADSKPAVIPRIATNSFPSGKSTPISDRKVQATSNTHKPPKK